ncbi:MAG: hypothetical protein HOP16_01830 [Acidobacteria bacterium]|nr:hypothetical protein [Acidobacteriota bacterium]
MSSWLAVYLAGFVWGLLRTDARPLSRLLLALLWPIGPAAFVVVLAILVAVSPIAFPLFGALLCGAAGAAWWVLT